MDSWDVAEVTRLLVTVGLLALAGVLLGCMGQPPIVSVAGEATREVVTQVVEREVAATATPAPATLNIHVNAEPPTLDPALAIDGVSLANIANLFVGLTRLDEAGAVQPWAATEWEVSDDGRTYTFHLRDDLVWVYRDPTTGESAVQRPLTAQDFEYGIKRTLDPSTASEYAYVLYLIEGAEAYSTADPHGETVGQLREAVGVRAIDEQTLTITFVEPIAFAPSIASLVVTYAQPREPIEEWGEGWSEAGRIWTSGAFTLEAWQHNAELALVKNPFYFEADDVQIERIEELIVKNESTALALYETDELDVVAAPIAELDRIRRDSELSPQLAIEPDTCTYYYGFVTTKPPVDKPAVRRALSATIGRVSLIENVTKGGQLPAHSFAPPGIFGHMANNPDVGEWMVMEDYATQVELARQWMAQGGFPDGEGLDLTLMYDTAEVHAQIAQAIQSMWLAAFPEATITVENQEWGVYLETTSPDTPIEEKSHVYRMGWCADYRDQNNWLNDNFNCDSDLNSSLFCNEEFDQIVEAAAVEQDPQRRIELYERAETILVEEQAVIAPIYHRTDLRLVKPYMEHAPGQLPWYRWRIDTQAKLDGSDR
ncbi:MAG: peptide ABC transporter substrate-binding protein [Chloroflexota bacterium]|nr:peptide ABC transporter substrate-binding protein [Chloroflexota bacterium]